MQLWQLVLLIAIILIGSVIVYQNMDNHKPKSKKDAEPENPLQNYANIAERQVESIFNNEFREELRNRGRLHFEKIIGENAMFLQQDLRLTTTQLNEYMKNEITRTLKEEFAKYEQSITDAKKLAIDSIEKTQKAIEEQREILGQQLREQVETEKTRLIERFDKNMADIINHYVLAAIGNQIDLNDQLDYILSELETNKKAIIEDIKNGT